MRRRRRRYEVRPTAWWAWEDHAGFTRLRGAKASHDVRPIPGIHVGFCVDTKGIPVGLHLWEPLSARTALATLRALLAGPGTPGGRGRSDNAPLEMTAHETAEVVRCLLEANEYLSTPRPAGARRVRTGGPHAKRRRRSLRRALQRR